MIEVTRVYKLYTFKELLELEKKKEISSAAMEKVRSWLRDGNTDEGWWEYVYEKWNAALKEIGFTDPDISFSGFWSQGDGASFTAGVDTKVMLKFLMNKGRPTEKIGYDGEKELFADWIRHGYKTGKPEYRKLVKHVDDIHLKVVRTTSQYSHFNTCDTELDYYGPDKLYDLVSEFRRDVEELREHLSKVIYKELEEEYDSLCEDESLEGLAEANNYTFTIEGEFEEE